MQPWRRHPCMRRCCHARRRRRSPHSRPGHRCAASHRCDGLRRRRTCHRHGRQLPATWTRLPRGGCCLLTGACPGVPHEVVLGAKSASERTCCRNLACRVSQGARRAVRLSYQEYDVLVFTGLGLMGRELVNIHSSDIVIVAVAVQERSGSLRSRINTASSLAC